MTTKTIEPSMTVNDVLLRHPATAAVFKAYHIDACCGGAVALESVARRHAIDLDALITALECADETTCESRATS